MDEHDDDRRPWFRIDRILSPDVSIKKTLLKLAPTLKVGSIFGSPMRAAIASATIVATPAVALGAAESAGAIDFIDADPQAIELTVLSDGEGVTVFTDPPLTQVQGTVFARLFEAIESLDQPVTVTVAPVSAEVAAVLSGLQTGQRRILAALAALPEETGPPFGPKDREQLEAIYAVIFGVESE